MGLKITNETKVITTFRLIDKEVSSSARDVMREYAMKIRDTARDFAPVLEHRIEKAIKILPSQGNQYSLRLTVAVEGVVKGRDVTTYAAIVHEYPWEKRGVFTRLKGPQAGPRYLKRAVDLHRKDLTRDLQAAMGGAIAKAIRKGGTNNSKRRRR